MIRRNWRTGVAIIAVFSCAFVGGYLRLASASVSTGDAAAEAPVLTPGRELVLVYVGSSTCPYSVDPRVSAYISTASAAIETRAAELGLTFVRIGVARDSNVARGWEHLNKTGVFDEVLTGRYSLGLGVVRYANGPGIGKGATPQMVLLTRDRYYDDGVATYGPEEVHARLVGLQEIGSWVERGVFLPPLGAAERP